MSELETLKKQIETVGEEIKTLKTNGGDKETITKKVAELLAVKKAYADANNGIGVDGKPYEQPLSKAEKKKKAKAEKAAAAAAVVSSDDQTSQVWNSINSNESIGGAHVSTDSEGVMKSVLFLFTL